MPQTIIIGDLHGCFDELNDLLDKAALGAADRVIAVGDLTVKGNKNREVLNLFSTDHRFISVLGNHDRKLLRYWHGETVSLTPAEAECCAELAGDAAHYAAWLSRLPLMIDLEAHLVVHAGVRPGIELASQSAEDLTELRTLGPERAARSGRPWYGAYQGEKTVLFGHWPMLEPVRTRNAIGLDTGCVYGHRLTAYLIEADQFISVPARRAYDPPRIPLRPAPALMNRTPAAHYAYR